MKSTKELQKANNNPISTCTVENETINWVALPHCPEGQLVKAHNTDAGWDIMAAETVIITPYSERPFTWEDFDLLDEIAKSNPQVKDMKGIFLQENGLRTRSKILLKFNQPFESIKPIFQLFDVSVYKKEEETYLLDLKALSYDVFIQQYGSFLEFSEPVAVLQRKKTKPILVKTGIQVQPQSLKWTALTLRSSMSKYGVTMPHSLGIIDYEYSGEIFIALTPLESNFYTIFGKGERIAQLIPMEQKHITLKQVDSLNETDRGAGGFGSSGSK